MAGMLSLCIIVVCLGSLSLAFPFYPHPELEYRTEWMDSHQGPVHFVYTDDEEPLDHLSRSAILQDEDAVLNAALNKPPKIVTDEDELALDEEELSKDDSGPTSLKDIEEAMKDDDEDDDEVEEDEDKDEEDKDDEDEDEAEDEVVAGKQREQRYLLAGSSGINDSYGWYGWPGSHGGRYNRHHSSHNEHHHHMPTYHHGFYTGYYK